MLILETTFRRCKNFLSNSNFLRKLIYTQHRLLPMPLWAFDWIFRSGFRRRLFDFYGANVAKYSYLRREGQLDYWLSKESLYWHFWRQTDTHAKTLREVASSLNTIVFKNEATSLTAVELGFGVGKDYAKFFKRLNFKKYIAVEPNAYLCDYAVKKFLFDKNLEIINALVGDFIEQRRSFDFLFCSGGVFMYLDQPNVNAFFQSLKGAGVKVIIILNEGTPGDDITRDDRTTMFNFKQRLITSGYSNARFIEKQKENGVYSYFVMC